MTRQQLRTVPGNFCRNGNFIGGSSQHWNIGSEFNTPTFTYTGSPDGACWITCTLNGINGSIYHNDYIPVRYGEIITHSVLVTDCTATGLSISSLFYDGAFQLLDTETDYSLSIAGSNVQLTAAHRVPLNAVYMVIRYYVLGTSGQILKFTGASVNIQDNNLSQDTVNNLLIEDFAVSGNVAPGTSSINTLEPSDTDKIYKILGFWLYCVAVPGATTGQHRFDIEYASFATLISVVNNYNAAVGLPGFDISKYATGSNPVNQYSLIPTTNNLYATSDVPLVVRYTNSTNATQTQSRAVKALVLETYIDKI